MGRYSDGSEQRFRKLFEREFDRMQFNLFLMRPRFGESVRKVISIDASYISKSGKKTPYIGKFWSGCASRVKRGLEILGIGIIDIDSRDCMMLRAEQTPERRIWKNKAKITTLWTGILTCSANTRTTCLA